ncbi:MAG: RluA family pseudouridine synthase [Bdellovibrionales bacterium]|nr:RluA family pseudouridine synthase [Bdellovibrionales bacterium]
MSSQDRIKRVRVETAEEGQLDGVSYLSKTLNIPKNTIEDLLAFGSIYKNERRYLANEQNRLGDHFRVHIQPRRYNSLTKLNETSIVFRDDNLLVVDKPSGLPVHPMLDNIVENVISKLTPEFGPLHTTHRLDIPTAGVLILARNKRSQAEVNSFFSERRVEKYYECLTAAPLSKGLLEHQMLKTDRAPKVLRSSDDGEEGNWMDCRLEVQECNLFGDLYVSKIRLLTGRPHQIRAQLAFVGAPILGDDVYGTENAFDYSKTEYSKRFQLALICKKLEIPNFEFHSNFSF